jgi:hypothetical protein
MLTLTPTFVSVMSCAITSAATGHPAGASHPCSMPAVAASPPTPTSCDTSPVRCVARLISGDIHAKQSAPVSTSASKITASSPTVCGGRIVSTARGRFRASTYCASL